MKNLTGAELRTAFLQFFENQGHSIQPSSSLVPGNDPTLLFTNAGMVQFKDVFLGREKRNYVRATTSQRCVRAGGKHNDLENVGYTARHHTFFEMLGNFSFGDYFKQEAIHFAWDFLTKELGIPAEKLWVTVFDEDSDAEKIWLEDIKVDPSRLSRIGAKDNFWSMGDIGPCGPCTEIFYDHGEDVAGGPPGTPEEDGDRYIEIWNLVFMQYDRDADGHLTPLPKPSVDTGMGLERIAAVLQGVHNNYEIDLFQKLLVKVADLAGIKDLSESSLRVIADHIRSCCFLIVDDVLPSNEGRGYVLRRIIRRAIRHGYRLGIREVFFYQLVAPLVAEMGEAYPELIAAQGQLERVLKVEEERFAETLEQGMKILETCVEKMTGKVIPGDVVFQLYDTYGFPVDLTADYARENDLTVDHAGFDIAMGAQRERARAAKNFGADYNQTIKLDAETEFTGYQQLNDQVKIIGLFQNSEAVDVLVEGTEGVIVLDSTPFYAESGGQVGDLGRIEVGGAIFEVTNTQKQGGNLFLHYGKVLAGEFKNQVTCTAMVAPLVRQSITLNHSATHLLHAALRQVLGDHVTQKGSLVNAERLRFDFSHFEPMTADEIKIIERMVNQQIRHNAQVTADIMSKDDALKAGAMALFGEKYGDEVRVLKIGEFSTELCGGIHVQRAGDIGLFKIISETGVASGVRRLEAITGEAAIQWLEAREKTITDIANTVKVAPEAAAERVQQLMAKSKLLEKELERLQAKLSSSAGGELANQAVEIDGIKVLAIKLEDVEPKAMGDVLDQLKNKLGSAAIVLAAVNNGKVNLIAGVSKDQIARLKAGDLVNSVATQVGGKGGGRPDMARAGGSNPEKLEAALKQVPDWVREQIGAK
ncbi:alanyl-tRNA synthetase [Bathymodiolus platifrons methanotrophic gill symbiont]|uniref:alanine--tRNA ligase n=1 Tax=Bathymodiolus platifrons methanotrophic gill symbiont TaxID=113268 RepID=UPI000B63250A|nr:alanine--tRNA ligase [Bathymodiolus platifrons methanotrophic gill symbiont]MCK5870816.1 alanine--tRNA ligase [Methyloprofundus sp.]GAW87130.1 alanyl-tRNA synthetase [Bathymodiolus platifrons methanotrophic gill symbiont]GFO75690.1 alanyl-tRNA synthetase [Bathymodiolus platifrons methanotrophic gill symbiont]